MTVRFSDGGHPSEQSFVGPSTDRRSHPVTAIATMLVVEMQRVGWDLPGLDVSFVTVETSAGPARKLHAIEGKVVNGPFRILFDRTGTPDDPVRPHLSEVAMPPGVVVTIDNGRNELVFGRDEYRGGDWKSAGRTYYAGRIGPAPLATDQMRPELEVKIFLLDLLVQLRGMPSAPGYDEVDHRGDANLRRLARESAFKGASPTLH